MYLLHFKQNTLSRVLSPTQRASTKKVNKDQTVFNTALFCFKCNDWWIRLSFSCSFISYPIMFGRFVLLRASCRTIHCCFRVCRQEKGGWRPFVDSFSWRIGGSTSLLCFFTRSFLNLKTRELMRAVVDLRIGVYIRKKWISAHNPIVVKRNAKENIAADNDIWYI